MNKFMTRLYSAEADREDLVLDQISNDITGALVSGIPVITEEYEVHPHTDDTAIIVDRVNNENTRAQCIDGLIKLKDMNSTTVPKCNHIDSTNDLDLDHVSQCSECSRMIPVYLVGDSGDLLAVGPYSRLVELKDEYPGSSIRPHFSLAADDYLANKVCSDMSIEEQKLFTRSNRLYAVEDETSQFKGFFSRDNAKALIQKHPNWIMVKKSQYKRKVNGDPATGVQKSFSKSGKTVVIVDKTGKFLFKMTKDESREYLVKHPDTVAIPYYTYNKLVKDGTLGKYIEDNKKQ